MGSYKKVNIPTIMVNFNLNFYSELIFKILIAQNNETATKNKADLNVKIVKNELASDKRSLLVKNNTESSIKVENRKIALPVVTGLYKNTMQSLLKHNNLKPINSSTQNADPPKKLEALLTQKDPIISKPKMTLLKPGGTNTIIKDIREIVSNKTADNSNAKNTSNVATTSATLIENKKIVLPRNKQEVLIHRVQQSCNVNDNNNTNCANTNNNNKQSPIITTMAAQAPMPAISGSSSIIIGHKSTAEENMQKNIQIKRFKTTHPTGTNFTSSTAPIQIIKQSRKSIKLTNADSRNNSAKSPVKSILIEKRNTSNKSLPSIADVFQIKPLISPNTVVNNTRPIMMIATNDHQPAQHVNAENIFTPAASISNANILSNNNNLMVG